MVTQEFAKYRRMDQELGSTLLYFANFFHFDEVMKCGTGAVIVGVQLRLESFKHR